MKITRFVNVFPQTIVSEPIQEEGMTQEDLYTKIKKSPSAVALCGKVGLKTLAEFTRKSLCHRPATLLERVLRHWSFPVNFAKFLENTFFKEHLGETASRKITDLFQKCNSQALVFCSICHLLLFAFLCKSSQKLKKTPVIHEN